MLNLELRWIEGYDRLHFNEGKILPIAWNMSKYYTGRSETKLINFTFSSFFTELRTCAINFRDRMIYFLLVHSL